MEWWRCKHGAPFDPKWRAVATRAGAGIRPADAWAVFTALCDRASQATDRGSLQDLNLEDLAAGFGYELDQVERIVAALKARNIIDDERVTNWQKHQPKRERDDDLSTERVRAHRSAQKIQETPPAHDETPCNANVGTETPRVEKSRVDTEKKDSEAKASAPAALSDDLKKLVWQKAKALGIKGSAAGEMAKLCGQDWSALENLFGRAAANDVADPTSWCFAELRPAEKPPPKKDKLTLKLEELDRQEAAKKANGNGINGGSSGLRSQPNEVALPAAVRS